MEDSVVICDKVNMAREWFDSKDKEWEKLEGEIPINLLDIHPSGKFVAMQVLPKRSFINERAAIWNTKTHKIYWNPGNLNALCWIENGNEILVLEEKPKKDITRPTLISTPVQSELQHFVKRMSWPGLDAVSYLEVKFPLGWLTDIAPSPTEKLACFVWQDQCESGIEYVSWEQGELLQLPKMGFSINSNLIRGPVFSPDGSIIVITFGSGIWWDSIKDKSSQGGKRNLGFIIWSETKSGIYQRINIDTNVPAGWRPNDPIDIIHNELLSLPIFLNQHEVKITLPTGEERIISL